MCDPYSMAILSTEAKAFLPKQPDIPPPPAPIPPPPKRLEKISTPKDLTKEPQLLGLSALRIPLPSVTP